MSKKLTIGVAVVAVIIIGVFALSNKAPSDATEGEKMMEVTDGENMMDKDVSATEEGGTMMDKGETMMEKGPVKEFTMTSSYEVVNGQPAPQFSMKEIAVKKGDTVRIKVTNTRGTHDFTIDEYQINKQTPENQEVVIEFTADKAGEFTYYCSKMNHRQLGQFGTLKVLE